MDFKTNVLTQMKKALPESLRTQFGADIYANYSKLRATLLGAVIDSFGDDYKIEYALVNRSQSQSQSQTVGKRIGKAKRERIVFLHGFADCKENFFDAAHLLVPQYDLLIPDLPGFGKSFKKKREVYNLEHYAKWLCELFDDLGWSDFHLIGNSLGGAIALEIGLRRPELVKSLTLIDPAGIVAPGRSSIYDEFLDDRIVFEIHSPVQFDYFLNRVFQKPPVIPPLVYDHLYRTFARHSKWNRKILVDLLEGVKSMDDEHLKKAVLNDQLKEIKAPTLILWGEKDSFFPPVTAHIVRREIPNSQLIFLPGLGHSPQNEAPILVMKHVRRFIKALSK